MIEKFFTISPESQFNKDYEAWYANAEKTRQLIVLFFEDRGIESKQYRAGNTWLSIVPTENDRAKFGKELCKLSDDHGVVHFRESSKTCKAWAKLLAENNHRKVMEPRMSFYIAHGFRSMSRHFTGKDGVHYGWYQTDCNFEIPSGCEEIKGWQFYKALDDLEQ